MRWRRRTKHDGPAVPPEDAAEAREAVQRAEEEYQAAREHNPEVTLTVRTLKRYGDVNHFAEVIHKALGGPG